MPTEINVGPTVGRESEFARVDAAPQAPAARTLGYLAAEGESG